MAMYSKNDNRFAKIQLSALLCPAVRKHDGLHLAAVKTTDTAKFSTVDRHQQGTPDFYCRLNAAPESNSC